MNKIKSLLVIALAVFVSASAFASTQNVKVSGSLDAYAFYRSNFDLTKNNDAGSVPQGSTVPGVSHSGSAVSRSNVDEYFMSITQVQISADLTDNVSTVINLINQRDWNGTTFGSSTSAIANEFDILLDLAYVQMKQIFYSPLTLTIGRQDLVFGRGFIVGWNPQDPNSNIQANEFTQIQSFDAIRATLDFSPWTIDLVYSKINEGSTNAEDDRDLYIANINYKFAEYNAVAEAYYVGEFDRLTLASGLSSGDTRGNDTNIVGGRVQFDPISQITLGGEVAYQFGNYRGASSTIALSSIPERDREALGVDLFGEYRWDNAWKPMLGVEYVYLSGEEDLSATTSASYGSWNGNYRLPVYGWIRDYLEVYYATGSSNDQAAGQNQQHICVYGSIKPLDDLQLAVQFYHFWTTDTAHAGITTPGSSTLSSDIGNEIDTVLTYNYTEDVTFTTMVDWFIPGDYYTAPFNSTATQVVQEVKVVF